MSGQSGQRTVRLSLYIAAEAPRSVEAVAAMRRLMTHPLLAGARLEIIDVVENSGRALADQVFVVPVVVLERDGERFDVFGDRFEERVILALGDPGEGR